MVKPVGGRSQKTRLQVRSKKIGDLKSSFSTCRKQKLFFEHRLATQAAGDLERAAQLSREPNVHLGPERYRANPGRGIGE